MSGSISGVTTPVSYTPDESLTFDQAQRELKLFQYIDGSIHWWIGDLLLFSELRYGEQFSQLLDSTGLAPKTLTRARYVASKFEPERRRSAPLSFSHHRLLADLGPEDQDRWLDRCEAEGLSVHELSRLRAAGKVQHKDRPVPDELWDCVRNLPKQFVELWAEALPVGTWGESYVLDDGRHVNLELMVRVTPSPLTPS